LLTPFDVEGTGKIILVNRGWVPIDACKSRMQRVQYSGEGIVKYHLRGVIRKEEWLQTTFGGDSPENHKPAYLDKFWSAMRPYDIVLDYFKKRFGRENVSKCVEKYGAYHYFIEMVEDHSGEDQILIGEKAYPVRRTSEDLTRTNLSPAVHLMYSLFWFFVSAGNVYILRRMWADRMKIAKASRLAGQAADALANKRREEAARLESELAKLQGAVQDGNYTHLRMAAVKAVDDMNTTTSSNPNKSKMFKEAMGVVESANPYKSPTYRSQSQEANIVSPPVEAAEQQAKVQEIVKEQQKQQQQQEKIVVSEESEGKSSKKKGSKK
jgi:cytochrome oxidase assembly protein ShyY1